MQDDFISRYKELIRMYHPDHCSNEDKKKQYHEITIKLNALYEHAKKLKAKKNPVEAQETSKEKKDDAKSETRSASNLNNEKTNSLLVLKNQDYIYYRLGITYFQQIHPTKWNENWGSTVYDPLDEEEYKKQLSDFKSVLCNFTKARYCFYKVIEEYPESPWVTDSIEKINILKKRLVQYDAILKNMINRSLSLKT